ncbi:MAG TPA: prolipoprotein diacylglyceryl transferase family protein [Polyangia bacterium]|nr:prolipoprotein diacylglyceryl transferase family protein [Polyangia bacterium]
MPAGVPASVVLTLAGVVAAAWVARAGARRRGLPARRTIDGLFLMIAVGLLIGHVADVVLYRGDALRADWRELLPWSGGVCTLGALAGAGLVGAGWFRRAPGGWLANGDNLVTALSLGWGIGRIGCFIDHDHLGRLTDVPFAVAMPGGARHDLGLYEAALALLIFVVLRRGEGQRPPGRALALAALLFGLGRFAIEQVRADDLQLLGRRSDPRLFGLTLVQYAAVALIASGALLWRRQAVPDTVAA